VAPPANLYDFTFLAPCPASGLMVNGDKDRVVPSASVAELAARTKVQKGVKIEHCVVLDANHFFQDKIEELIGVAGAYVDRNMAELEQSSAK
jgi:alpha/beta superfamily hydrolase